MGNIPLSRGNFLSLPQQRLSRTRLMDPLNPGLACKGEYILKLSKQADFTCLLLQSNQESLPKSYVKPPLTKLKTISTFVSKVSSYILSHGIRRKGSILQIHLKHRLWKINCNNPVIRGEGCGAQCPS